MATRKNRLARRVTLIFFFAIAALLILLALSFASILYQSERASTAALQNETAQRAAVSISAHLDSLHAPLLDAVQMRPDLPTAGPAELQSLVEGVLSQNSPYLEVALLDVNGNVRASAMRSGNVIENSERDADRVAAFEAAHAGQSYLGHVHLTATGSDPYIVMGEPLPSAQGALVAWIDLRHIWEIVAGVRVGDSGYAYVLDADGNLIAYRDPAPILARENLLQTNAGLRGHVTSTEAASEYTGLNGQADIGAHAPIQTSQWMVVVETPLPEAYAVLYRALAALAALLFLGIVVSAFLARYLAVRLLDPVELLREGAALIGQGHLDHRIVIETGDEVQALAAEFNQMTQNLLRARTELEDWAHEMERRVEERTAQVVEQKERLAVMEERQRMARELHDSISQALFTLTITLESAQGFLAKNPSKVPILLDRAHAVAKEALGDVRLLIAELRPAPLAQRGLTEGLREQLSAIATRTGIPIDFHPESGVYLTPENEDALYRIALEAVNNAMNHAHPTRVAVSLFVRDHRVMLTVVDDGAGFEPEAEYTGHYGLKTMRERARAAGGTLTVESRPGSGTTVRADVPLERVRKPELAQ